MTGTILVAIFALAEPTPERRGRRRRGKRRRKKRKIPEAIEKDEVNACRRRMMKVKMKRR